MTPDERAALRSALEEAERSVARLRALLAAEAPGTPNAVALAVACRAWGCSKDAGRKRARRGAGFKYGGRWYVASAALNERASANGGKL